MSIGGTRIGLSGLSGRSVLGLGPGVISLSGTGGCTPHDRIDGAISAGATFTHPADGVVAYTATPPSSGSILIHFRIQDADNYWLMLHFGDDVLVREVIEGSQTTRINAADVLDPGGSRVAIVLDGATISVYVDGNLVGTPYASATNFATETDGEVDSLGTAGGVADLKTWTLACRGEEGV